MLTVFDQYRKARWGLTNKEDINMLMRLIPSSSYVWEDYYLDSKVCLAIKVRQEMLFRLKDNIFLVQPGDHMVYWGDK
jgi:hypothetical protein